MIRRLLFTERLDDTALVLPPVVVVVVVVVVAQLPMLVVSSFFVGLLLCTAMSLFLDAGDGGSTNSRSFSDTADE